MFDVLRMLRPKQWVKNLFVLAPLFFALQHNSEVAWIQAGFATLCFICLSSITYILNDLQDLESDKQHPEKQHRPIAAGKVSPMMAWLTMFQLAVVASVICGTLLPTECLIVAEIYLGLQILYSFKLKHVAILDVMIIASGFVLRVLMGAYAIGVPVSAWIILCSFLLALFMGFGKRYHELAALGEIAPRASLQRYSKPLLDRLISISCGLSLISYALYAVEVAKRQDSNHLFIYTVLFVAFGLFRYLQRIYVDEHGGEPENIVLKDPVFLANGMLWFATCMWIFTR